MQEQVTQPEHPSTESHQSEAMTRFLNDYPVTMTQNVQWGDMDALGHVNNTVYYRYFENIRIDFFQRLDMFELMEEQQLAPVLSESQCRFRRPVFFPDTLLLGTRISTLADDRLTMEYGIFSHSQQALVTQGRATVVCINTETNRPTPLPPMLKAALADSQPEEAGLAG
ncbi:thioesterase family protein [Ferrimonas gelatinilytica]|uniref:Thioesterase family protein n=1 Tax=Ferrimonas gelatinilytica TaxID=1255257 RepID=A0ABP9S9S6_9GAMM